MQISEFRNAKIQNKKMNTKSWKYYAVQFLKIL